jgi:hypothetical protein
MDDVESINITQQDGDILICFQDIPSKESEEV